MRTRSFLYVLNRGGEEERRVQILQEGEAARAAMDLSTDGDVGKVPFVANNYAPNDGAGGEERVILT